MTRGVSQKKPYIPNLSFTGHNMRPVASAPCALRPRLENYERTWATLYTGIYDPDRKLSWVLNKAIYITGHDNEGVIFENAR